MVATRSQKDCQKLLKLAKASLYYKQTLNRRNYKPIPGYCSYQELATQVAITLIAADEAG